LSDPVVKVETLAELNEILDNNEDVVVDFSALAWCVPCQRLYPHFEAVATQLTDLKFVYVDADSMDLEFRTEFPVMSVPTVIRITNGERQTIKSRTAPLLVSKRSMQFVHYPRPFRACLYLYLSWRKQ
jgi:thiol-disulfide isomerase/thioredoxin